MKKVILLLIMSIFLINLVFAQQGQGSGNSQITASSQKNIQVQEQSQIRQGNYTDEKGNKIQIMEKIREKIRLKLNGIEVDCSCNLTQEQVQNKTRLKVQLSNGKNSEIKVMPNTASETALKRLRLKVCSQENNCTIELKEVGKGNQTRIAYEIQIQRHAKLLGMFRLKMQTKSQVDAETGELIRVKKPWWAFLAIEPEE